MRKLTDSERKSLKESWSKYTDAVWMKQPSVESGFSAGFLSGLFCNQAKLDKLEKELAEVKEELRITKRALDNG